MIGYLDEYAGKPLRNAAKGEISRWTMPAKAKQEAANPAAERAGSHQGPCWASASATCASVGAPDRFAFVPRALADYDMALHLQRLLREAGHEMPDSKPMLEINPEHPLLKRLSGESDDGKAGDLAALLLEQAEIAAGAQLPDPSAFVQRMNRVLLG